MNSIKGGPLDVALNKKYTKMRVVRSRLDAQYQPFACIPKRTARQGKNAMSGILYVLTLIIWSLV